MAKKAGWQEFSGSGGSFTASTARPTPAGSGTGGTVKDGVIELQGDQVAPALTALEKAGNRPKQAGG
jgi:hypothetical protein